MAKERIAATWNEIDPATLTGDAAALFGEYKAQYRKAKEAKALFEAEMQELAALPSGYKLVFGYNFGKLSVAVVADDKPKAAAKPASQSLAEWLQGQAAAGARA